MCGIAGILRFAGRPYPTPDELKPALDALAHRGPDGAGTFADREVVLGNRRLAIIDRAGGAQPMVDPVGGHAITYNGEIHDYLEHRERLVAAGVRFRTRSDTEVLLALLAREGPAALARLSGMFAFALWDGRTGRLTLGRDAFGVKPLLYRIDRDAGEIRFASELGALLAGGAVVPRLHVGALAERLAFQIPLTSRSLVTGVEHLPPGTVLTADRDGRVEIRAWHDLVYEADDGPSPAEWEERLRGRIDRAGRIALRSDVPLGVTLSGGLDSSLTAGVAARHAVARVTAYTGYFPGEPAFDERRHARRAAAELGLDLVEVPVGDEDLLDRVRELAVRLEGPIAGPGSLPQLVVAERAAQDVKVLVGGQGADETFGGYARHALAVLAAAGRLDPERMPAGLAAYAPLARRILAGGGAGSLDDGFFAAVHRGGGLEGISGPGLGAAMADYDPRSAFGEVFAATGGDPFFRMVSFERRTLLPALLHVEDRVTMAASVESRVPLLDLSIVELAARIPPRISFPDAELKGILRRAAAGLAPPSAIARRDKMGFPVPLGRFAEGATGRRLAARLRDGPLIREGLLDPDGPARLLEGAGGHGRHLWFFLLLSEWMDATGVRP